MNELKAILSHLVSLPSITPEDTGCQEYMINFLKPYGFSCQPFNHHPVSNFFACYGVEGPLLVFAGHTDVVPPGDLKKWHTDPFVLQEKNEILYGRGVADMKGSLACMLLMAKRFITTYPNFKGRLGFLITSGEEGDHYDLGTPHVMAELKKQNIFIDYCVIGEPSSTSQTGDTIKVGRRGSLNAKIYLQGKQGHVAYPHLADNPIHSISPVLANLSAIQWDKGNDYFPPTSMQMTHLHSGGHASNIIPGELELHLNFRYSTEQSEQSLKEKVHAAFEQHQLQPTIDWRLSGKPFLTEKGTLLVSAIESIKENARIIPELSTSGGTSDGRFIAPYGVEVLEIGPSNASIHQINECVSMQDLERLELIYFSICKKILRPQSA